MLHARKSQQRSVFRRGSVCNALMNSVRLILVPDVLVLPLAVQPLAVNVLAAREPPRCPSVAPLFPQSVGKAGRCRVFADAPGSFPDSLEVHESGVVWPGNTAQGLRGDSRCGGCNESANCITDTLTFERTTERDIRSRTCANRYRESTRYEQRPSKCGMLHLETRNWEPVSGSPLLPVAVG